MKLRPIKHEKDFYSYENQLKNNIEGQLNNKIKKKIKVTPTCISELRALNFLILKGLASTKRSPFITGKIEPSTQLCKYLRDRYHLNSKFQDGFEIFVDHQLYIQRFFNEEDYSEIYSDQFNGNSFQIRLTKPQKLYFFNNSKLEKKEIFYKKILHFKFTVINYVLD